MRRPRPTWGSSNCHRAGSWFPGLLPELVDLSLRLVLIASHNLVTFPLEYWKVLQSSTKGYTKKNNVDLGTRLHSAYVITVQRDVLFSVTYWSLLENFKMELLKLIEGQHELVNFMSGILAGSITAFVTLPLDVVKTRKQVSTRRDLYVDQGAQKSTANILQQIYYTEGIKGLFRGYQPRIAKVTVHSGLVYMMYEYFKEHVFRAI